MDGTVTGSETGGMYDVTTVTGYSGGSRMMYTGTDVMQHIGTVTGHAPGVLPGTPGPQGDWEKPDDRGENFRIPEGETMPEGFRPGTDFESEPPEGELPTLPEGETMPEGFDPGGMAGQSPMGGAEGEGNTLFYMQDKVNFFSGLTAAE